MFATKKITKVISPMAIYSMETIWVPFAFPSAAEGERPSLGERPGGRLRGVGPLCIDYFRSSPACGFFLLPRIQILLGTLLEADNLRSDAFSSIGWW